MDNTKKNFIWNMIGTTINAFNSLFFMIMATRINGIDDAGIFTFAFSTALLFNIIGVYSGRVYQVTDKTEATDKDFIISKFITCFVMLIVSILFVLINNYSFYKSSIILLLCFLKMLEAFSETIYAIFQRKDNLYLTGISLTLKSLINLFIFFIIDLLTHNLVIAIIGMIITYGLIMIFYDYINIKKKIDIQKEYKKERIITILKKGFGAFIISFLTLYLINSSKYVIDYLLVEKYQTIFGILLMPATVILLFTQFIIHPFLNLITNCVHDKKYDELKKIIFKFLGVMILFGIVVIIVAYFLGIPVLELIYGISLNNYKKGFMVIMIGGVLYGMSSILSSILIAMRHLNIQIIIYSVVAIVITVIEYFLINIYGVMGACYAYFIMTFIVLIMFLVATFIFIKRDRSV